MSRLGDNRQYSCLIDAIANTKQGGRDNNVNKVDSASCKILVNSSALELSLGIFFGEI